MDFTSRQLRAFLLVAQQRSFTRAAEAMFITFRVESLGSGIGNPAGIPAV
jgi:hypothetical protein